MADVEMLKERYAPAADGPDLDALKGRYGSPEAQSATVQPTAEPGVQQGRWNVTITSPNGQRGVVEVPGSWEDATGTIAAMRQQFHPATQFGIEPVHTEASPWQPEASDPRLASGRFMRASPGTTEELQRRDVPYTTSATPEAYGPGAAGAFDRYLGKPDLPLEEAQSPIDLAVDAYTLGLGASGGKELARWIAPKAGKLVTLLGEGAGLELAHKVNQATGTTSGAVTDVGVPDVMNFALPYGAEALRMAKSGAIRYSRAGTALTEADAETALRQAAYDTATTDYAARKAQAEAEQAAAEAKNQAAYNAKSADYAGKTVMTRNLTVEANETAEAAFQAKQAKALADAQAATDAQAALHTATTKEDYDAAWAKWEKSHADYLTSKAAYDDAVQGQGAAVARARDLVKQMKPETPAWVHYQNLAETAPKAPIDIDEVKALSSQLRSEVTSPQTAMPSRLETIMTDLEKQPSTIPLSQVHENYMKELGPLTRSADPQTRRVSKQLLASLQDAMETSAGLSAETQAAVPLLRQANAAARKQFAVDDLNEMYQASIGYKQGNPILRPDALAKRLDDAIANRGGRYPLFKGSFTPEELKTFQDNVMELTGTPTIPTRAPTVPPPFRAPTPEPPPSPVVPKDVGLPPVPDDPQLVAKMKHGGPPEPPAPVLLKDIGEAPPLPEPVTPQVKGSPLLAKLASLSTPAGIAAVVGGGWKSLSYGIAGGGADALYTGLSRLLVSRPGGAAWLRSQMTAEGTLSPQALGVLTELGQQALTVRK